MNISSEVILALGGFAVTLCGALIATVWAMLNERIKSAEKEASRVRERIADLYVKLELARERADNHRLELTELIFRRTEKK